MYEIFTLNNGLRVVAENIPYVNSVSVGIFVLNGSRNECPELNGISHFIEHMLFKGTNSRSSKEIVEAIENVGGQLNAYTSKESTCYYVKTLNTHMDLCFDILSDMLFNSKFSEEDIEKEKAVVIEEINMGEDTPEDLLADVYAETCFGKDSLGLPILGTKDIVSSFTHEKLIKYKDERYTPHNSVLSICGNFDVKVLKELIEKYFSCWESKSEIITDYSTPKILCDFHSKEKNIEQVHINLGLKGLPIGHKYGYSLVLLNTILGGGASSILFQKLREEQGLCYNVASYPLSFKNIGILNLYVGVAPSNVEKSLDIIKREIDKFKKFNISEEQLQINKEKIKANYMLSSESTSSRMFNNGKSMLFLGKVNTPEHIINKVDSINRDGLAYVLENCFKDGVINGAFVGRNVDLDKCILQLGNDTFAYNQKYIEI